MGHPTLGSLTHGLSNSDISRSHPNSEASLMGSLQLRSLTHRVIPTLGPSLIKLPQLWYHSQSHPNLGLYSQSHLNMLEH